MLRCRFVAYTGCVLAVLASVCIAHRAAADDPSFLTLGTGYFDIAGSKGAIELRAEYRSDLKLWVLKPFAGVMLTTDSAGYGYAGLLFDLYIGRRLVFTPSLAAGLYEEGTGKDLGHVVEFRSAIELAYRFDDRSRLGLSFYHLSNASFGNTNPVAEVLSLSYSIVLGSGN